MRSSEHNISNNSSTHFLSGFGAHWWTLVFYLHRLTLQLTLCPLALAFVFVFVCFSLCGFKGQRQDNISVNGSYCTTILYFVWYVIHSSNHSTTKLMEPMCNILIVIDIHFTEWTHKMLQYDFIWLLRITLRRVNISTANFATVTFHSLVETTQETQ